MKVPGAVEVGATIVWVGAPTDPETLEKFDSVGVSAMAPLTVRLNLFPAHAPDGDDHVAPLFDEESGTKVGAGLTLVVGVPLLHFQPMFPAPLTTTKYWVLAVSFKGLERVWLGFSSAHPGTETLVATSASFAPGAPLTLDQMLIEYEAGEPELFRYQKLTAVTDVGSVPAVNDWESKLVLLRFCHGPSTMRL